DVERAPGAHRRQEPGDAAMQAHGDGLVVTLLADEGAKIDLRLGADRQRGPIGTADLHPPVAAGADLVLRPQCRAGLGWGSLAVMGQAGLAGDPRDLAIAQLG